MQVIETGLVHVFTFKTGILSRIAHDLRFSLGNFEVRVQEHAIQARFWPKSLRVDGVMRGATLDAGALRESDKSEILRNVHTQVLHTQEYPEARLEARLSERDGSYRVNGSLELRGNVNSIEFTVATQAENLLGRLEIQPSQWGIRPFRALAGAIRLEDRVAITFDLPAR